MRFHDQVKASVMWGVVALGVTLALAWLFAATGFDGTVSAFIVLSGLMIAGVMLGVFGVMRVAHRWVYRNWAQPSALGHDLRARMLQGDRTGPPLQWWLHLTPEGHDRDNSN